MDPIGSGIGEAGALVLPMIAAAVDIGMTQHIRGAKISSLYQRARVAANHAHKYQTEDRENYLRAYQQIEAGKSAFLRIGGTLLSATGGAIAMHFNQYDLAYGFFSVTAAEIAAGTVDVFTAGPQGMLEASINLLARAGLSVEIEVEPE